MLKQKHMELQNLIKVNHLASQISRMETLINEADGFTLSRPKIIIHNLEKKLELLLDECPLTAHEIVYLYKNRLAEKRKALIEELKKL